MACHVGVFLLWLVIVNAALTAGTPQEGDGPSNGGETGEASNAGNAGEASNAGNGDGSSNDDGGLNDGNDNTDNAANINAMMLTPLAFYLLVVSLGTMLASAFM
ncbi:hypothetical protein ACOMHN_063548 [Nucella lapillus]